MSKETPEENFLGGFLIPSPTSGLPPFCAVPQAALIPYHTPTASRCAPF